MQIVARVRCGTSRDIAAALALIVGIALGGFLGNALLPLPDTVPLVAHQSEPPAATFPDPDHETIVSVIRQHRGKSDSRATALADAIYRESLQAEIDPLLVTSIVAKESSFRSQVVSRAGAVGLMQLRPWVAQDVAERFDLEWAGRETLHSPSINVRLGILYYKELMERFEGDAGKALTAYNYGPTRVSRQLREGSFRTSRYAERVLELYDHLSARRQQDA